MPGQPNRGKLKGKQPENARPFKKGDPRTIAASKKGVQALKAKCAKFKTLRDAAEALKDIPSDKWPGMSNGVAAVLGVYKAASEGDAKALKVLAELHGEMIEKIKVENVPILHDDIPRAEDPPKK